MNATVAEPALLSPEALRSLLELARATVAAAVRGERLPPLPELAELRAPRGVFVSLHRSGDLRGCLGHIEPDLPVGEAVRRMAVASSRDDPRFPPVGRDELEDLDVEVSVLSPMVRIRPEDVVPGRDGLIVQRGPRSGVLLPQVAPEQGWDREAFLRGVCRKAALPADAWRDGATELFAFRAQVVPARPAAGA
ncbi:MAG TPA: AmmeMemoRadiSam system protein A [Gemmatimonadales bacterium]|nr:AmmeMemoRadiSam system protein A [Gemmatimonadales bacterium]